MKTLIRHATVVTPRETLQTSVLLEGPKIAAIDVALHTAADEVIDARGLYLIPGVIDDQVHFREPGATHKEDIASGSRGCAKGGVTTFLEMPNTFPTTTTRERLAEKRAIGARTSRVNYGFYMGATPTNVDELRLATGTPGIKIFIGSSTGELLVDGQEDLERIFAETTLPITAHCEDETTVRANAARLSPTHDVRDHSRIRDHEAAWIATRRALDLAFRHHHRFHVLHVSTAREIELIRDHRRLITAEVCPHHLFFNVNDYDRLGSLVQMNPSLKFAEDNAALWQALLDGDIQMMATDHAPHTLEEKQQEYPKSPSGLPCVENFLPLMLDQVHRGRCSLEQVVQWLCDAPARVWDIVDKGRIEVGYDADVVLVDLNRVATIRNEDQLTRCGWSPWHGVTLTGWPVATWVRGRRVFAEGRVIEDCRGEAAVFDHARGGYWATA
ncbi:MAG: dihydroorotase [Pirellulales bacterium]